MPVAVFTAVDFAKAEAIAHCLGDGWVFNEIKSTEHFIYFTSKNLRHCEIFIRQDSARWTVRAFVLSAIDGRTKHAHAWASVNPARAIQSLANDIKRRVIKGLAEAVAKEAERASQERAKKDGDRILIDAFGRLVDLKPHRHHDRDMFCLFEKNGVNGVVRKHWREGFMLELDGLDDATIFKIMGILGESKGVSG